MVASQHLYRAVAIQRQLSTSFFRVYTSQVRDRGVCWLGVVMVARRAAALMRPLWHGMVSVWRLVVVVWQDVVGVQLGGALKNPLASESVRPRCVHAGTARHTPPLAGACGSRPSPVLGGLSACLSVMCPPPAAAVGAGFIHGSGFGINTLSSYVTRSCSELQKLCVAMG